MHYTNNSLFFSEICWGYDIHVDGTNPTLQEGKTKSHVKEHDEKKMGSGSHSIPWRNQNIVLLFHSILSHTLK